VCSSDFNAANKLLKLNMSVSDIGRSTSYSIRCKKLSLKGVKQKSMQVSVIMWISSSSPKKAVDVVADWVRNNIDTTESFDSNVAFNTEKLSVGPCAYRADDQSKYVKVRFDGVSIPVYFNNEKLLLGKTTNELQPTYGPAMTDVLIKSISDHATVIFERASKRPLNLSGIPEYALHQMSYWIAMAGECDGIYHIVPSNSPLISVPGTKVYPLCSYGYDWRAKKSHAFILIDDVFYNVKGFRVYNNYHKQTKFDPNTFDSSDYHQNINYSYYGDMAFFTRNELEEVPADDTFVREKALRTLKAKI